LPIIVFILEKLIGVNSGLNGSDEPEMVIKRLAGSPLFSSKRLPPFLFRDSNQVIAKQNLGFRLLLHLLIPLWMFVLPKLYFFGRGKKQVFVTKNKPCVIEMQCVGLFQKAKLFIFNFVSVIDFTFWGKGSFSVP